VRDDKRALRAQVQAQRDRLPAAVRAAANARITERLLDLPAIARTRCALVYLSFGSEFDTSALLDELRVRGARLVLPRVDRSQRRLQLFDVNDVAGDTQAGTWGIREPRPDRCVLAQPDEIDAVLAPGVAFTPTCVRLGYGGGFYDRLLASWHPRPPLIAAAFEVQILDSIPVESHDVPMDVVVTEARTFIRESAPAR